ncbi:uncharacterized protein LOC144432790 [Glandiceps talaboti]
MFKEVVLLSVALAVASLKDSPIKERQEVGCEFRCFTGECFPQARVCDGNNNCPNGEDEHDIVCLNIPPFYDYPEDANECVYTCTYFSGEVGCIGNAQTCNLFPDCKDWSDELDPAHGCIDVAGDCRCANCAGCYCIYAIDKYSCECSDGYHGDGFLCVPPPATQATITTQPNGQPTSIQPSTSQPASNEIHCEADEMFVAVSMEWMATELHIGETDATEFHLNDPSCEGTMGDGVFVFRTMFYNCLTTSLELQDGNVSYSNMVFSAGNREIIEMTCLYPVEYDVAPIHIVANPCHRFVHFLGFGTYTVEATLYSDDSFTDTLDPATEFPIVICEDTFIYFGIAVKSNDYNLELLVQNCFMSDNADPGLSSVSYGILTDGCLSDGVAGYEQASGNALEKLFCVNIWDILQGVFVSIPDDIDLYLHCSVRICIIDDVGTPCDLACVNGLKRELGEITTGSSHSFITHGPFTSPQGERCTNK